MLNPVFCLLGPTASGKTALACELVARYPFEIISVDSAMIYRDMDIGTAKPSAEELNQAPHHLINIKDPIEIYSAAQFCHDAHDLCETIQQRGKIPLLVGGTMMYFNALQQGLSTLPTADESTRQRIEQEAVHYGWSYLHQQLSQIDPATAARVHAHDTQRIQRALEVYYLTGNTLSTLIAAQKTTSKYQFINIALVPEQRSWLHERIASRFLQMLDCGFLDEVRYLQNKWGINMDYPAMRCVGYRQALEYLQGQYGYDSLCNKGIAATRQLAKRQLTWLRHWEQLYQYDPQDLSFQREIMVKISELLDNQGSF